MKSRRHIKFIGAKFSPTFRRCRHFNRFRVNRTSEFCNNANLAITNNISPLSTPNDL